MMITFQTSGPFFSLFFPRFHIRYTRCRLHPRLQFHAGKWRGVRGPPHMKRKKILALHARQKTRESPVYMDLSDMRQSEQRPKSHDRCVEVYRSFSLDLHACRVWACLRNGVAHLSRQTYRFFACALTIWCDFEKPSPRLYCLLDCKRHITITLSSSP